MHPNHLNFDDWDSHALFSALYNLFSVLYSVPACLLACLPACLSVWVFFFFKDVSLLQMIGDTRTKEYRAGYMACLTGGVGKNLNVHTYTHPVCISWVQGL